MRVLVRADASFGIGSGHVMRNLAFADALRRRGANVSFLMRSRPGDLLALVASRGFETAALEGGDAGSGLGVPLQTEYDQVTAYLSTHGTYDLIVVDHYALGSDWENAVRGGAARIFVIDDLANRAHACDILLDQNFGADDPQRYRGLVPQSTRLLLGPAYALLREEFRTIAAAPRERDGRVTSLLVFMGGTDDSGQTLKALRAAAALQSRLNVSVVLPPESPHAAETKSLCERFGFAYLGRVEQMAALMDAADASIGAMGIAAWERCALGLPSLVLSVAENQEHAARACDAAGAVRWLGDAGSVDEARIARELEAFISDSRALAQMSSRSRALMQLESGFPTDRTVDAILESCHA